MFNKFIKFNSTCNGVIKFSIEIHIKALIIFSSTLVSGKQRLCQAMIICNYKETNHLNLPFIPIPIINAIINILEGTFNQKVLIKLNYILLVLIFSVLVMKATKAAKAASQST